MTEYFPKLMSDIKAQIQLGQRTPSRINAKKKPKKQKMKETTRHIIFKMQKSKDKEKLKRYQGKKHLI